MKPLVEEATVIHLKIADEFGIERFEQLLFLLRQLAEIGQGPSEPFDH